MKAETLIVLKALGKEHIDEIISISRRYNTAAVETEKIQESKPQSRRTVICSLTNTD